ncbi:MAG: hypothetical protein HUJ56_06250 [Erysipelotrichaceae bacterium]|nr:hypothetical protein [Erysipelotrichaceae bacterium]
MLKKIIFTFMIVLALSSIVLAGYVYFEPEPIKITYTTDYFTIEYDSLDSYINSGSEATTHLFFFCCVSDNDCQYIENTLFTSVDKEDPTINTKETIEYVEISEVVARNEFNLVQKKWNITNYPAFVSCTINNGEITFNNQLIWDPESSLSVADIITWFSDNNIGSTENVKPMTD